MNSDAFRQTLLYQKDFHSAMLLRIKERKAKIRKFMLFVNNALNETENEVRQLIEANRHVETLIDTLGNGHVSLELEKGQTKQDKLHVQSVCTASCEYHEAGFPLAATSTVQLEHSDPGNVCISSNMSFDETVGIKATDLTEPTDSSINPSPIRLPIQPESHDRQTVTGNDNDCSNNSESFLLTPVTSLVHNVLLSVKDSKKIEETAEDMANSESESDDVEGSYLKCVPTTNENSHTNVETSNSCIGNSFESEEFEDDDDVTTLYTSKEYATSLTTKDSKKNSAVWPIGYPKRADKGELIVETVDERSRVRKRVRQTRLDGYLAKAALTSGSKLLCGNISSRKASRRKTLHSEHHVLNQSSKSKIKDSPPKVLSSSDHSSTGVNKINTRIDVASSKPHALVNVNYREKRKITESSDAVKGRARKMLNGYKCKQCYEYYISLNLSELEIQQRLNEVCRHRASKPSMETPPNFWNMSIISNPDNLD